MPYNPTTRPHTPLPGEARLNTKQACEYLGWKAKNSRRTMDTRIADGRIVPYKDSGHNYYYPSQLDQYKEDERIRQLAKAALTTAKP